MSAKVLDWKSVRQVVSKDNCEGSSLKECNPTNTAIYSAGKASDEASNYVVAWYYVTGYAQCRQHNMCNSQIYSGLYTVGKECLNKKESDYPNWELRSISNLYYYIRASPNSGAVHHLAYIPGIPDSVRHEISKFNVNWKTQSKEIMFHCNRELYHAILRFLLNNKFVHAYKYGMVIKCFDGRERHVYPRLFTWVLLATIRDFGSCPCPCCLCSKSNLDQMGTKWDKKTRDKLRDFLWDKVELARKWIYTKGMKICGSAVEAILKLTSSVPTKNTFLDRLGLDFNLGHMLVVDLMHEFELGVWKALFSHLIRVLHGVSQEAINILDDRFRQMPTFGLDTIRAFANNAIA
ncbi:hypothetical protein C8R42DRAFT_708431 [Lentinula raphanica]|nr:hypothetical protein C8R42DRAFT_708431 [Lentinula raphanica]